MNTRSQQHSPFARTKWRRAGAVEGIMEGNDRGIYLKVNAGLAFVQSASSKSYTISELNGMDYRTLSSVVIGNKAAASLVIADADLWKTKGNVVCVAVRIHKEAALKALDLKEVREYRLNPNDPTVAELISIYHPIEGALKILRNPDIYLIN